MAGKMAIPKTTNKPPDVLQQMFNEVLIQTGKALKNASRDGKSGSPQASLTTDTKIPVCVKTFNAALDDFEQEILRAKSVLQRDLNQLRASRRPPPERTPVAPPAPMTVELESPTMTASKAPTPTNASVSPFQTFQSPKRPIKQESKPVAPFPNMGFDLTNSPEVKPVPSPKMTKKEPKNSPRPATLAGAATRPSSAPPRKETKVPIPTIPRSATATPQVSVPTASAPAIPQNNIRAPPTAPASAPPTAPPQAQGPAPTAAMAPTAEPIFTNITFSLATPSSEMQNPMGGQAQPPQHIDLVALGQGGDASNFNISHFPGGSGSGPANVANMDLGVGHGGLDVNMSNVDAKIDTLFDLGSAGMDNMEMDYDLSGDAGDNSNFNDLYFNSGDDNMGSGEFDNTYFDL